MLWYFPSLTTRLHRLSASANQKKLLDTIQYKAIIFVSAWSSPRDESGCPAGLLRRHVILPPPQAADDGVHHADAIPDGTDADHRQRTEAESCQALTPVERAAELSDAVELFDYITLLSAPHPFASSVVKMLRLESIFLKLVLFVTDLGLDTGSPLNHALSCAL